MPVRIGELGLYLVRDEEDTWVLARDEDDALAVLLESYGMSQHTPEQLSHDLGWENGKPEKIEPVSEDVAKRLLVRGEVESDGVRTLLACAIECSGVPGIVCSTIE